jgi:hypothetical protein
MAYAKVAADLITYTLGLIAGDIEGFETTVTPEVAAAGQRLVVTLRSTSTEDQDDALQQLFFSLFSQKRCGTTNKYTFPPYSFLVLYSFTEHGTLRPCNMFSQFFSKVIFFARAALFKKITAEANLEQKGFFE